MNEIPKAGEVWVHHNGGRYYIMGVSNTETVREDHPPDVVYVTLQLGIKYEQPNFRKLWTRPLSDWHRSFEKDPRGMCV